MHQEAVIARWYCYAFMTQCVQRTMPVTNELERDFPLLPSQTTKRRPVDRSGIAGSSTKSRNSISTATLSDLPDEILLEILRFLPGIDVGNFQLPSLLNLSLTSRRFHRIVTEKIYRTYDSLFCEPYRFTRAIIFNPGLAEKVQKVNIIFGSWSNRENVRYKPTAQDKKTVKEGIRALAIPGWKDWVTDCNENRDKDETLYNVMLLHTPNITSLGVVDASAADHRWIRYPPWIDIISKASNGTLSKHTHRFEHLRSVRLNIRIAGLSQLAPMFRLQSLLFLSLQGMDELCCKQCIERETARSLQRLIPERCNNLEEICLESTFLRMRTLGVLIASSRHLKSFKYDVALDHLYEQPDDQLEQLNMEKWLEHTKLSTALSHQSATLESLDITYDALVEEQIRGRIHLHDDLTNFVSLKRLSCPLGAIAAGDPSTFVETLPSSLQAFRTTIRRYTSDHKCLGALEHMAYYSKIHTPHLKEVQVIVPKSAQWFTFDWERLLTPFSVAGVSFVVEKEEDQEDEFSGSWGKDSSESSESSDEEDLYSDNDSDGPSVAFG
jgi:hypothetical protein